MRLWASVRAFFAALLHRSLAESEMEEELRAHVQRRADDLVRQGIARADAERRARVEFGGIESVKEKVRDLFWETYFDTLLRDARYAARSLRRDRGFALTAIFALALGVGSTCMVFSVIYNGLLRPFPYKDANRLATFYVHDLQDANLQEPGRGDRGGFTSAEFLELRQRNGAFEDMIGFITEDLSCTRGGATTQLHAALVTPNTFQFLGVDPLVGRSIGPADAEPAAPPVFAMNYRVWQKHFNGDPKVVGTSFVIAGQPRTLVAVMPPRFQIDPEGSDIWIPSKPNPGDSTFPMNAAEPMHLWWPLGRLRSGMSQRTATSDLNVVGRGLAKAFPSLYPPRFTMVMRPFADVVVGNFKSMLYALAVAVAMLLLITCANVANLLLARGTTRRKEMAIRASIGASRGRLALQLLIESFLLAATGGGLGCLFATWGLKGIVAFIPAGALPEEAAIKLNSTVLLFALGATMFTALLCGLVSAVHGLGGELKFPLAGGGRGLGEVRGGKVRGFLVITEVGLSIVLLVGAGLMTRTLFALTHVNLGFSASNLLVTELSVPNGRFRTGADKRLIFEQVLRNIASSPGVVAAATTASLPPYGGPGSDIEIPGRAHSGRWSVAIDLCSEGLFRTLGIGLLRGRLLSAADILSARRVVVVNETFADTFFAKADPLGQRVKFKVLDLIPDAPHDADFEIVGVVKNIRNRGLRDAPAPQAYLPYTAFGTPEGNVIVRSAAGSLVTAKEVQDAIWSADPSLSLTETVPLETYLERYDYAAPEFGLATLGAFAGIGLLLAAVGIFGVMAYSVSLRTHEIGIRVALGAQRGGILKMILAQGNGLVASGIVIGLIGSYGLTRFLASQIWGVAATDPWTCAAAALVCVFVGFAGCFLPARRAAAVDPMVALRHE